VTTRHCLRSLHGIEARRGGGRVQVESSHADGLRSSRSSEPVRTPFVDLDTASEVGTPLSDTLTRRRRHASARPEQAYAGLSKTWSGFLRDWDRTLRVGNYPESTGYDSLRAADQLAGEEDRPRHSARGHQEGPGHLQGLRTSLSFSGRPRRAGSQH
jgi:hypothetical protein